MDFYHKLSEAAGADHILKDEPMSAHTTFRIGGPADYFVVPEDAASLGRGVALCRAEGVDYFITGNGSNLLVGDGGYRGVVFHISLHDSQFFLKGIVQQQLLVFFRCQTGIGFEIMHKERLIKISQICGNYR